MTTPGTGAEKKETPEEVIDRLRAKIRADTLFLKLLLDQQMIKPSEEHRVRSRLKGTVGDYPTLFAEKIV